MTIHPINAGTFLLFAARTDLLERGLHPDTLTHEHTTALAKEGLSALDRNIDAILELESYPGEDGLLLFIHTTPAVWRFFDCDAFLNAVTSLPHLTGQPLYQWNGDFWLVGEGSTTRSEFADPVRDDPLLSTRLAEYAQPLF